MASAHGTKPGIANAEEAWGCDPYLIGVAEWSGMDAFDIEALAEYCQAKRCLLIFRAPGGCGRNIRGIGLDVRPKSGDVQTKTAGRWLKNGDHFVTSDYDLLSAWKRSGAAYAKLALPKGTRATGEFLQDINRELLWPLQHGANDDFLDDSGSPKHPDIGEKFVVISDTGRVETRETKQEMKQFYAQQGLTPWLYE